MSNLLVFPGQGSQFVGMGKSFSENFKVSKNVFEEVNESLSLNLTKIMWEGDLTELTKTENAQPALMAVSIAMLKAIENEVGINYDKVLFMAGHSLGEYSALVAANSLKLDVAAKLLKIRGQSMQKAVPVGQGAMAAIIGTSIEQVENLTTEINSIYPECVCDIANDNAPGQVVISGHNVAIDAAKIICEKYPDIEFVMLFVGSEQNRTKYLRYLKKKTIDSNLSKNIFFLGSRSDMASIYSLSDVVLSTSVEEEAFGRITAEASSMSKPIIATNLGGSKDIIKHNQTGWLIEKSAPLLLADTIIKVIKKSQNEKDKMGRDARKRIIEEFGLNMMLKRTLEVYKEVYEEKHIDH